MDMLSILGNINVWIFLIAFVFVGIYMYVILYWTCITYNELFCLLKLWKPWRNTKHHLCFRHVKWKFGFWKRMGVPSPDYFPYIGAMALSNFPSPAQSAIFKKKTLQLWRHGAFQTPLQIDYQKIWYMRKGYRKLIYFCIYAHELETESTCNNEPDRYELSLIVREKILKR